MNFLKHKNAWFAGLGISVFLIFFCFRPLNSPSYRIIVADGLGYYSYLPAKFIYNDKELEFKWFDEVFNANYEDHLFEKPTQNFMVKYRNRMINLYYPGQSFLQLPFFLMGHLTAKAFNYPADGFSFPYQLWIGLAGIFYTLLGLLFCSKLIFNISQNRRLSVYITLLIFLATNLFTYSIFAGCYTHCYSFAFITLALYFSQLFFQTDTKKFFNGFLLLTCAAVVVFLRPVNCILLASVLYFYKPFTLKALFREKINTRVIMVIVFLGLVIIYNLSTTYTQTHALIANTYTIGRFYFDDWSHVWANFAGFQNGIFWYTPIIFLGFIPLFFIRREPKLLFLLIPVLGVILLYSFWFYWNIVNRTLVDFSGIMALLFLWLFMNFKGKETLYKLLLVSSFLCIPFYQLKAYQLRHGILNSSYTYWKYYANYFFTMHHVDVYPVNPKTIVKNQGHYFDFEEEIGQDLALEKGFESKKSAKLDHVTEYACSKTFTIPAFFSRTEFKKIKTSFWFYRSKEMQNVQLVYSFVRNNSVLLSHPFYINASTAADTWELKEFGMDVPQNIDADCEFVVYFWNPEKKSASFIDNFKVEFIVKDGSDEIVVLPEDTNK